MDEKKAVEVLTKQYNRQNEHIKENYKRLSITVKKDVYEMILNKYGKISMNGYVNDLIAKDLDRKVAGGTVPEKKKEIPECFR